MKRSAAFRSIIGLILGLLLLAACKKSSVSEGSGGSNSPVITPFGDTAGPAVSASIGPNGGTLTSSDGRAQLVIPAGALSQTTVISIQPIFNLCPGGLGLAYDLLPNGITFATPASLVFHYSDSDINGTEPLLITSAFQDSANAWEFNDTEKDVDSVNQAISFDINHFTPYGFIAEIVVSSRPTDLKENQTSLVKVQQWIVPKDILNFKGHKFVQSKSDIASSLVTNWSVRNFSNASGDPGTIVGNGNSAVYKAPSNIDKDKNVEVSCDINVPVTVKLRGGGTFTTINPLHEENSIGLISGNYSFDISILVILHYTSMYIPDRYTDGATMQLDIKYNDLTISNIINQVPQAVPNTGTFADLKVTWLPDLIGVTNILPTSTGTVTANPLTGEDDIDLTFVHSGTVYPEWLLTPSNGPATTRGGFSTGGTPATAVLVLHNQAQTVVSLSPDGLDSFIVTAIPRQ
jgi:hypothetical protein